MSFQIETGRLILRDVREDDTAVLLKQAAEPEAQSGILSYQANEFYNRNYIFRAISEATPHGRVHYGLTVTLKDAQTVIGTCHLTEVAPQSIETNIGWHYGSRFWGRGYATEAARALLYIGFGLNDVAEIFADCFADNKASIRIMEKLGMTSSPTLGLFNMIRGRSYGESKPAVRYIISRHQWSANKNNPGKDSAKS